MQTIEREYTIKALNEGIENGNIVFNHPMQRKPGQWDLEQQSLLVHSILAGFAVPQTYALQIFDGDFDSFSVLDGKQRLTTIYEYMKDGFKLSEDTPTVNIQKRMAVTDGNGQRKQKITVDEYEIASKYFSEIDPKLQEKLKDKALEKQRKETEAFYSSITKSLEQRKEKFQELTEILEKAELSAKLKQLGIDEEALVNGSEEEFEKLKNAYLDVVFKLNEGNDEVLNSLRELSGYDGTAPAMLEDSNTELDEMNQNLTTSNTNVGNVNSSLDKTATTTGTVASNVSDLSSNLDAVNGSITAEQTAFEGLKNIIDEVITAINLKIDAINAENAAVATATGTEIANFQLLINKILEVKQSIESVNDTVATMDRQPIDNLTSAFQLLNDSLTLVSDTLGNGVDNGIAFAIQALNEISFEEGIIAQFTNLKEAIDSVTAAISGGGGESSEGEGSGSGSGSKGGKTGGKGSEGKGKGESGGGNSLTGAIKEMGETAKEVIGEPDAAVREQACV